MDFLDTQAGQEFLVLLRQQMEDALATEALPDDYMETVQIRVSSQQQLEK